MKRLSSLIREDKEFSASLVTVSEQLFSKEPLPLVINGLTSGAAYAYVAEMILEINKTSKTLK